MRARAGSARRYAEAAFEIARRDGTLDDWLRDLRLATDLLRDERIQQGLDNPALPLTERRSAAQSILGRRVSRPALNLIQLLVDRGRVSLLPAIADEYATRLNRERGILRASVTSAAPLDEAEIQTVRARIEELAGARIDLTTSVDPALIGGLTVRMGDQLIDASVRGRLERLRDKLVAGAR